MEKIKIAAVSYINTYPFLYGIINSVQMKDKYELIIETPANCAKLLGENKVDIGLIPVAIIPALKFSNILTDYCIGANGEVKSVVVLSNSEINKIDRIYLDYQSKTSVQLVKILAKYYWKKNIEWIETSVGFEKKSYNINEGIVIIGDRSFNEFRNYKYIFDLAAEWKKFTKLPFVFAAWVANKPLKSDFIDNFNQSLKFGINHIPESIKAYNKKKYNINLLSYLEDNIDFLLDKKKIQAMDLFLSYTKSI